MAYLSIGKLKLLYILEMLLLKTDENHRIGTPEILAMLRKHDIIAERKSVYFDIEVLKEYGLEIAYDRTAPAGYCLLGRKFELPEVKLLMDVVQASKCITTNKTIELINKIGYLTSSYQARELKQQVYAVSRIRSQNESIYYNIDAINEAINTNSKISFEYLTWNMDKKLISKCNYTYIVSPCATTWENGICYMLGYSEAYGMIKSYRVDRMRKAKRRKEKRDRQKSFDKLDLAHYAIKSFDMFNRKVEKVSLECDNELVGIILDRFGPNVIIVPTSENTFQVTCEIALSGHFFGWVVSLGPGAKIVYPKSVVNEFKERLTKMI